MREGAVPLRLRVFESAHNEEIPLNRTIVSAVFVVVAAASASAQSVVSDQLLNDYITRCPDTKIVRSAAPAGVPAGLKAETIEVQSASPYCATHFLAVSSRGDVFLGSPWSLTDRKGTLEEKVRSFSWQNFQEVFSATRDGSAKSTNGLRKAKVTYTTEQGPVLIDGWVTQDESALFVGEFYPAGASIPAERMKRVAPLLTTAPAKGNKAAKVTIVEFSDFQCPSCKESSRYMKPVLDRLGDSIQYYRLDLPLISSHPWAFHAAVAGRAIHRQNPDAFWKYRDFIYENQADLNAFTLEDQIRGFAEDNGLDIKKFEVDVQSATLREEVLRSVGTAFTMGLQSTPSFLVNGIAIYPGKDGSNLEAIVKELSK